MNNRSHPHVLISGGSSGIGKALAQKLAKDGYNISIIARDKTKLDQATIDIKKYRKTSDQKVLSFSSDVTNQNEIIKTAEEAMDTLGVPSLVITSAGIAIPGYFQALSVDDFENTMQVNYLGTVYLLKTLLPAMIEKKEGHIVLISSAVGLIGTFGYTAYSASKFALRGLAEALRSEMKPLGIQVSIVYPPDTDTPQFHKENETKPIETKKISSCVKIMHADTVAQGILNGIKRRKFSIPLRWKIKVLLHLNSIIVPLLSIYFDRVVQKIHKSKQLIKGDII